MSLAADERRQLRRLVAGLVGAVVVLAVAVAWLLPRSLAFSMVFEENLELKRRLGVVDHELAEVEALVMRLRLYDAQLDAISGVDGAHGPLPEPAFGDHGLQPYDETDATDPHLDTLEPPWDEGVVRPAEAWAASVQARAQTFLSQVGRAEPHINAVVEELEELRALRTALPTTWPATGTLNSGFGWRRSPIVGSWTFHSGIDLGARTGTPIYAPAPGVVTMARTNEGYGRMIELDHGFGITTTYAHCSRLFVEEGQEVERGDPIAAIGATGRTTGPHLHFEVHLDGHAVDPLDYLPR